MVTPSSIKPIWCIGRLMCWRKYSQLGYTIDHFNSITWDDTKWGEIKGGQVMAQASPVFARIELDAEKDEEEKKPKDNKKKGKAKVKVEQPQTVAEA